MPDRIALVTGACGFLGRHVARALAQQGFSVRGLGHGTWTREEWSRHGLSSWYACDVTLENLLTYGNAPDLLVHCAGSASVAFSMAEPLLDFRRTVETTAAALEYLRLRAPGASLVLPSSGSVYGSREGTISETAAVSPQSAYAAHKLIAEGLCASYGRSFGIKSAIFRFFSVYGPGLRKQLLWDVSTRLARGEVWCAGSGNEVRDWLHVEDAAQLILRAIDHASPACPTVNGGSGVAATVRELVTELSNGLGARREFTFNGQGRPGDPFRFVADIGLARSWGWEPRVPWRTGVRAYAAWFAQGAP